MYWEWEQPWYSDFRVQDLGVSPKPCNPVIAETPVEDDTGIGIIEEGRNIRTEESYSSRPQTVNPKP